MLTLDLNLKQLLEAYKTLSDETMRTKYDNYLLNKSKSKSNRAFAIMNALALDWKLTLNFLTWKMNDYPINWHLRL